jgi:CHAD domain-containing protein
VARARRASSPGVRTLARQIRTSLAEVVHEVDEVVLRPHLTPESLHGLHRSMRRLRHALTLWTRVLRPQDRALMKPLDRRLSRLSRLVGRVRDRDVMLGLLEGGSLPAPRRGDVTLVARLRSRWRDDARTGRELLRVFLRSERDAHLFEQLEATLSLVPRSDGRVNLAALLEQEEEVRQERVRAAHRKARRKGTVARLHRLRIQVRRLRHLDELRGRLEPDRPQLPPPTVRRLQSQLGRLHDLDIVLDGIGSGLAGTAWGKALRRERRRVRRAIEASLDQPRWPWRPTPLPGPGGPAS